MTNLKYIIIGIVVFIALIAFFSAAYTVDQRSANRYG
jgi:hypothetical protein